MNTKTKLKLKIASVVVSVFAVSLYLGFILTNQNVVAESDTNEIMVYKSPTCGCCNKWVQHLENEGFNVTTKNIQNMNPIKDEIGVKRQFQSCHTAKIGKYFIEGHVPAKDIKRLLKDKPNIKGLAVPGMPMGSPGMEGHRKDNYAVVAVNKNNEATIYSNY